MNYQKLTNGQKIQPQYTSYTFFSEPPKHIGAGAIIRTEGGQLVHVTLCRGKSGELWLVNVCPRDPVSSLVHLRPPNKPVGETFNQRQNRIAAAVGRVIEARRHLKDQL